MKKYISPAIKPIHLEAESLIATSGGGVTTASTVGNEYTEGDVSYSNRRFSIWGDED